MKFEIDTDGEPVLIATKPENTLDLPDWLGYTLRAFRASGAFSDQETALQKIAIKGLNALKGATDDDGDEYDDKVIDRTIAWLMTY